MNWSFRSGEIQMASMAVAFGAASLLATGLVGGFWQTTVSASGVEVAAIGWALGGATAMWGPKYVAEVALRGEH